MSNEPDSTDPSVQTAVSKTISSVTSKLGAVTASGGDALPGAGTHVKSAAQDALAATQNLASSRSPREAAGGLRSVIVENPLGAVVGALAAGILVGLAFPVTDIEREKVGPLGDTLRDSAQTTANEVVDHGKAALADAVSGALGQVVASGSSRKS